MSPDGRTRRRKADVGETPREQYVVGVDLGGTKILAGVVGPTGEVCSRSKRKTRADKGADAVVERIVRCVLGSIEEAEVPRERIKAVGVGAPGALDSGTGVIAEAPNLGWRNIPLKRLLEEAIGLPVVIENDVNAGTWGEYRLGAGVGSRDLVGIFVGTGIGGGLILNGELYRGSKGKAGEIGHIKIDPEGPMCGCGQRGCLESLASRLAVQREYEIAAKKGKESTVFESAGGKASSIRSRAIAKGYESGDKVTVGILKRAAGRLADGVAAAAALLNPEMVVLGGGLIEALPEDFFEAVVKEVRRRTFEPSLADMRVSRALLGDDAVLLGAASIAREHPVSAKRAAVV